MADLTKLKSVSPAYKKLVDPRRNMEPWQENGQKCEMTNTGVCVANISKACVWPKCTARGRNDH